jgi:folate-binding protein YgfZ
MTETTPSPPARPLALEASHVALGARFEARLGYRLPMAYGPSADATAEEYAAAREAAGLFDLSERALLAASGPQRQKFLHVMLSNAVDGRAPGEGCRAALMDVKGHLLALLRVLVTPDAVLLEMPGDRLKAVEDTLVFHRVGAPVRFADRPAVVLGLLGPLQLAVLERAGACVGDLEPESHTETALGGSPIRIARAGDLPAGGHVLHVDPASAVGVWSALVAAGARPVGREAVDALRIEEGRAWWGPDVTPENLLHETGLLTEYHSPAKGCYPGQEVVARLEGRGGNVNKRLCGLLLSEIVPAGTPLRLEGRDAGRVTTAAVSPRLGPIALAYVQRSALEIGRSLEAGGATAHVVTLPFAQADVPSR